MDLSSIGYQGPMGPSSPGYVQGTANTVPDPTYQSAVSSATMQKPIAFNPSDFTVPVLGDVNDPNSLVGKAYTSLAPYYTKILQEAGGDVNRAIARLEQDYQTGVRYTTEDVSRQTGYAKEDLNAALKSLGITFTQEQQGKTDTLNQRGIALTQPGRTGPMNVATEGQGGTEMSMLKEDEQLRQEATQRAASRQIEQLGIGGQRQLASLSQSRTRGGEDVTRQYQQYEEQLQQERENRALGIGQAKQQEQLAQQGLDIQKNILSAQFGGSGGSGGSVNTRGYINPRTGVWDDNYHATGQV